MHLAAGQAEAQGHVTGRMVFSKLNEIVSAFNRLGIVVDGEKVQVKEITEQDIHDTFSDYNQFAQRPDSGMLMTLWYMGVPIDEFPPLPSPEELQEMVAKRKEIAEAHRAKTAPSESEAFEPEEEYPEGAVIFGGDYGDEEDEGDETPNEVPEVQQSSAEEVEPADEQDGKPVPAVP
jgi:hypothetical protein